MRVDERHMKPVEKHSLLKSNFLKFRCHLDSSIGTDSHREFTGIYYPRFRAMYLDECRTIVGVRGLPNVKVFPQFSFDVYLKPDNSYYLTEDFLPGAKISFGKTRSSRDKDQKTFVVVDVDLNKLRTPTFAGNKTIAEDKKLPEHVVETLRNIREGFIHQAGNSVELGIKAAGRRFRVVDDTGDRMAEKHEFQKAAAEVHIDLSIPEIESLFEAVEGNPDIVRYETLLNVIRGPMSEARKQAVIAAFRNVDHNETGKVSLHELEVKFQARNQLEVREGSLTEQQMMNAFLTGWDTHDSNGIVTFAEFQDYYYGVSAAIENDRDFLLYLASCWGL